MENIKQEFIQNCVQEDIDLYYSLHTEPTTDLIEHCIAMAEELRQSYQNYYQIKL